MLANSRRIESNQSGIHANLQSIVRKHLQNPFKKPFAQHTVDAFEAIKPTIESALEQGAGLIFDSGCGTAMSTRLLALQYPDSLVIGIDRSAHRLGKDYNQSLPGNVCLIQAECADFWRLAVKAGWKLEQHAMYYPNPYPKASQLKRRWHAHPVFPSLLKLGGKLELRSNWKIYVDEFCQAVSIAGYGFTMNEINPKEPMTLFEKKYQQSGQLLYSCEASLDQVQ
jgi:tRNA G46 methylase TrmB